MLVTPDRARRWLVESMLNGDPQRRVDRRKVCHYADLIQYGRWAPEDPQTIYKPVRIKPGGCVIDGHHRLHAVALADVPAEIDVRICE